MNASSLHLWRNKRFLLTVAVSLFFLVCSLALNYVAGIYATERASHAVADLILDHLPARNVEFVFVNGSVAFWVLIGALLVWRPHFIPFVVKSVTLFVVIRAAFMTLTHLGPYAVDSAMDVGRFFRYFSNGGDYFFSGHTGAPFLMALIFWRNVRLRWFFLIASVIFGFSVLLGHLHYSIDVFGAFFITYAIFHLALWLFPKDYTLFNSGHDPIA